MKRLLIFIALFFTFAFNSFAASSEANYGQGELAEALPDGARELLDENDITPDNSGALGLSPLSVLEGLWRLFTDEFAAPLKMLAALVGVILLCAVAEALRDGAGNKNSADIFSVVGVLAGAGMMSVYISDSVARALQTLNSGSVFLMTFVPIFAGIMAICGQLTTASVFSGTVIIAGQVFAYIMTVFLIPLVSCVLGVSIAGAVNPDLKIDRLAETVKKIVVWGLGLLVTVFAGLLSLQSIMSNSADTVALRTARFVVSGTVPIIGGAIGDALTTVRGSLDLLRGSTGTFGIIAGLMIFVPTLVSVFLHRIALSAASAVCEMFGITRLASLLKSGESIMSIVFAMLFCLTLLIIISVAMMLLIWNGGV